MPARTFRKFIRTSPAPAIALAMGLACGTLPALAQNAQNPPSLGVPGSQQLQPPVLEKFTGLPPEKPYAKDPTGGANVTIGTSGLSLPPIALKSNQPFTLAILGALAPQNADSEKYLKSTIDSLNLLRPDLVLTTGNLLPGMTRDGNLYAHQALDLHDTFADLKMAWLPCAGETDLFSGTRDPADTRFAELYQKYIGPLYYGISAGDLHAIVLDSEEPLPGGGVGISEAQLRWLKADLNRAFEPSAGIRPRWIIVVVHRPLWRSEDKSPAAANWQQVHALLAEFNRRPMVSVEGMDAQSSAAAPRVAAVIAGSDRAYSLEPTRDGIHYCVLGPASAAPHPGEDDREALRGILLLKFDPGIPIANSASPAGSAAAIPASMHPSLLRIAADEPAVGGSDSPLLPEDAVTTRERAVIDQIAGWGDDIIGIDGDMDLPPPAPPPTPAAETSRSDSPPSDAGPPPRKMSLHLFNPLPDPIDLQLRLAGTQFLQSASERQNANLAGDGLDLPWELNAAHVIRHLVPGARDAIAFTVERPDDQKSTTNAAPPQLEIVVHWNDPRGRSHQVILKRRVTLVPHIRMAAVRSPLDSASGAAWDQAASGAAYAWQLRGDEPPVLNPAWQLTADLQNIYVRVRVDDTTPSYWPSTAFDPQWGGLASDAVVLTWAKGDPGKQIVNRLWLLPFAPPPAQLWTNTGPAAKQTDLLRLSPSTGIRALIDRQSMHYTVTLTVPRKLITEPSPPAPPPPAPAPSPFSIPNLLPNLNIFAPPAAPPAPPAPPPVRALINISVFNNNQSARTWSRSWTNPDADPSAWGHVEIADK